MMTKEKVVAMVFAGALLLAGCGPSTVSKHVELKQGQLLEMFRLVRVTSDGKAEFHNIDAGEDSGQFHPFTVGVGQSFGLQRQSRHLTTYDFTVERADPDKQEATVLVRTTE